MTTDMVARNATRVLLGMIVVLLALVLFVVYSASQPRPLPRILDEHGNNILYTCPGDPRCTPVVR